MMNEIALLDAFRNNDIEHITEIVSSPKYTPAVNYGSPLHLVVSLSNKSTLEALPKKEEWINTRNSNSETPLHIAAKLGRTDLIDSLFNINTIDDTLRDKEGKVAYEVAKGQQVEAMIKAKKAEFEATSFKMLRSYVVSYSGNGIIDYFTNNHRACSYLEIGWIDINAPMDPVTEHGILHFAAKNEDENLLTWALGKGADPNVKDKKGKKPSDILPKKDHKLKTALKQAIAQGPILSATLTQATSSQAGAAMTHNLPTMSGNILKWTNYAVGYKSRYFVLENGVLSYFKSEGDYPLSCRGSISILIADVVYPDSQDMSRFDVLGKGGVRYALKARSPADAKKWVWAIKETKTWMIDRAKERGSNVMSDHTSEKAEEASWDDDEETSSVFENSHLSQEDLKSSSASNAHLSDRRGSFQAPEGSKSNEVEIQTNTQDISTLLYLLDLQLGVQGRIVDLLVDKLKEAEVKFDADSEYNLETIPDLLQSSKSKVHGTVSQIVQVCENREKHWSRKFKRERESKMRWEEIMKSVMDDEDDDGTARNARKVLSVFGEGSPQSSTPSVVGVSKIINVTDKVDLDTEDTDDFDDIFYDAPDGSRASLERSSFLEQVFGFESLNASAETKVYTEEEKTLAGALSPTLSGEATPKALKLSLQGYLKSKDKRRILPLDLTSPKPSLNVWSFLKSAIGKDLSKVTLPVLFNEPLSMLQRMCEDIEYIEILSLAARVGSKCSADYTPPPHDHPSYNAASDRGLDLNFLEDLKGTEASLLRLMFVAAYAMSNYSSTVGRTSKPFNPMLGETYEVVDDVKQYRYIAEQVCHHPPISACHCESIDYSFWTEVHVKSKFWGKSLEVHPLGNCHVQLGNEHYSWKKVTTSVNNLIVGTLWIDHYGDMVIKNWKTGEEAVLTFKPKTSGGWFGWGGKDKSAEKEDVNSGSHIVGKVKDVNGVVKFDIKGKWDTDLWAYPVSSDSSFKKPILLWKRNVLPHNSGLYFDFTSLALTLNELPSDLERILPSSDSRLRPDQRHLENSRWDAANSSKESLETGQRSSRKVLVEEYEKYGIPNGPEERNGIPMGEEWWVPRWFERTIDSDTGEEYWRFTRDYWMYREMASKGDKWPNWVPKMFS